MKTMPTNGRHRPPTPSESPMRPRPTTTQRPMQRDVPEIFEKWIRQYPAACLSVALLTGVTLGWLIKRK